MPSEVTAARCPVRFPIRQAGIYVKRTISKIDQRVRGAEMKARRQLPVLECQHALDESGYAGSSIQVSDVALERADGAIAFRTGGFPKRLRQALDFNRITHRGAGTVSFDVRDAVRRHTRDAESFGNNLGLAFNAGSEIPHLAASIVVNCRAEDYRVDR